MATRYQLRIQQRIKEQASIVKPVLTFPLIKSCKRYFRTTCKHTRQNKFQQIVSSQTCKAVSVSTACMMSSVSDQFRCVSSFVTSSQEQAEPNFANIQAIKRTSTLLLSFRPHSHNHVFFLHFHDTFRAAHLFERASLLTQMRQRRFCTSFVHSACCRFGVPLTINGNDTASPTCIFYMFTDVNGALGLFFPVVNNSSMGLMHLG